MMPFSMFLAGKYLRPKRTFLSVVTALSVTGVTIGVAVLVIVLSVMEGFDEVWREKILSFDSHVTVTLRRDDALEGSEEWCEWLERVDGVTGAAPFWQSLLFVQTPGGGVETPLARGVDPEREARVSRIPGHMVAGEFSVADGDVVLGLGLANRLGVGVGDTLTVYSPATFGSGAGLRFPKEMRVAGLFEMGMWEYDAGFMVASLWDLREFCEGAGLGGIQVMTADPYRAAEVAQRIRVLGGGEVVARTWMEQNQQLFAALRVEKNMLFFLLIFIVVVAAFGVTNTLITVTVQKTREIGVLRALGFTKGAIMRVFFWQGWASGVAGTGLGLGLGLLALKYRNALMDALNRGLGMELLPPELYHLSQLPAVTTGHDVGLVVGCVLGICTLAAVVPAWRAASLDPVEALRE
ncbi:MAG: ABC transporter permease [Kiritimatiellae bacterium]|nr:ABC transporter permease [Kiritimatiellia bacterium]